MDSSTPSLTPTPPSSSPTPSPSPPTPSDPPIPPDANLIIKLALRMHDCRRGGANTGDDGHEYLVRELGTDFYLMSFFADKRRFPREVPWDDVSRNLLEQFLALMCKRPQWNREECFAWLQDYWWLKALLDEDAKRIAEEAMEVAYEEGRKATREHIEQQLQRIKERDGKSSKEGRVAGPRLKGD